MAEAGALPRHCLAGGPCSLQTHIREWCLQGSRKWPRPPETYSPVLALGRSGFLGWGWEGTLG